MMFDPDQPEGVGNMRMIPLAAEDYDWAVYRGAAEAGVEVDLSNNEGTGGEADGDRLIGIELVWGSLHNDTFIASDDEDTFNIIHGDGGSDTVSYEASYLGVIVDLSDDDHHTTTPVTGDGTPTSPFMFPIVLDADDTEDGPTVDDIAANGVGSAAGDDLENDGTVETNGAFGDRLGSIENLTGSNEDDRLTGDANPNVLKGLGRHRRTGWRRE